jgi:hypothetical protein
MQQLYKPAAGRVYTRTLQCNHIEEQPDILNGKVVTALSFHDFLQEGLTLQAP